MPAKIYIAAIALLSLTGLFSCQKVIHVDLNSTAPRYVVEGNVTDQPGPYLVKITRSVNFDQNNSFPGVDGATVVITDSNTNVVDTLTELLAGMYQTHLITGVSGHTYKLSIKADGNVFNCTSTMPQQVVFDSVYTQPSLFNTNNQTAVAAFKDPVGTGNYYKLIEQVNDSISENIYVYSDEISDGRELIGTMNRSIPIDSGNLVKVTLECIDHGTYEYYFTLAQTIRQNTASPANPQSNITGGALGYFSAHTIQTKGVIAH